VPPAHYFATDPAFPRLIKKTSFVAASRSHCSRIFQLSEKPAQCLVHIGDRLERKLLHISAALFLIGSVGWCWPVISQFRPPILVSPAEASIHPHISHCQHFSRCRGKADVPAQCLGNKLSSASRNLTLLFGNSCLHSWEGSVARAFFMRIHLVAPTADPFKQ
jgi:hypothetical protein